MKRSNRSRRMAWMALAGILALQDALPVWAAEPTAFGQLISVFEIGRASCRERV